MLIVINGTIYEFYHPIIQILVFENTWLPGIGEENFCCNGTLEPTEFYRRHFHGEFLVWKFLYCVIPFSLEFVPKRLIKYMLALIQMMAWHLIGHKPLYEPMMAWFSDPDSKVHAAHLGPTWGRQLAHVGPMNLAIRGRIYALLGFSWLTAERPHVMIRYSYYLRPVLSQHVVSDR